MSENYVVIYITIWATVVTEQDKQVGGSFSYKGVIFISVPILCSSEFLKLNKRSLGA